MIHHHDFIARIKGFHASPNSQGVVMCVQDCSNWNHKKKSEWAVYPKMRCLREQNNFKSTEAHELSFQARTEFFRGKILNAEHTENSLRKSAETFESWAS